MPFLLSPDRAQIYVQPGATQLLANNGTAVSLASQTGKRVPHASLCIGNLQIGKELDSDIQPPAQTIMGADATLIYQVLSAKDLISRLGNATHSMCSSETFSKIRQYVGDLQNVMYIPCIEVSPHARGRQHTRALLDIAKWEARRQGISTLYALVEDHNRHCRDAANAFFNNGFVGAYVPTTTEPLCWRDAHYIMVSCPVATTNGLTPPDGGRIRMGFMNSIPLAPEF